MPLNHVERVARAVVQLHWPILGQGGAGLMPHLRFGKVNHLVPSLPDSITEVRVLSVEDQVGFVETDLLHDVRAHQKSAARHKVALTDAVVTGVVLAVPAIMGAVTVQRMDSPARMPEVIGPAEVVNLAADHARLRVLLGIANQYVEDFKVHDDIVRSA